MARIISDNKEYSLHDFENEEEYKRARFDVEDF
jgi:hypothetical protein